MADRSPKPVSASTTVFSKTMLPSDANPSGNVHGGEIMKLINECCGAAAGRPGLGAADRWAAGPGIERDDDIAAADGGRRPGHAVGSDVIGSLARIAGESECDGVVITHGTDTLEETAYALSLMTGRQRPIVLTGAMRSRAQPGADGPANLLAGVRVASRADLAALGPLVVIQDEIHLAQFVEKVHTSRVAAFAAPQGGPIGVGAEDRVLLTAAPAAPPVAAAWCTATASVYNAAKNWNNEGYSGSPDNSK